MKPLIILLTVFAVCLCVNKLFFNGYSIQLSARIAMAAMLTFTGIAHFIYTKGMGMMLPAIIPFKKATVIITGVIEILGSVGILIAAVQVLTAWLLIIFLILILPANIYATIQHVDYQKGNNEGKGLNYLWFRLPLQLFFILWLYFSATR